MSGAVFFDCRADPCMLVRQRTVAGSVVDINHMKNKVIIVFSTCPDETVGRALARAIVDAGLAACVNVVPGITSVYAWQGEISEDTECLLVIKTVEDQLTALTDRLRDLHSYELPEIVAVPVSGGLPAYLDWVAEATRAGQ